LPVLLIAANTAAYLTARDPANAALACRHRICYSKR